MKPMLAVLSLLIAAVSPAAAQVCDQTQKLTPHGGKKNDLFGYDVALDGDRALVGAWGDYVLGYQSGSAYSFDIATGATVAGCPGSGGFVPTLDVQGCVPAGSVFHIGITDAYGPAPAILFAGLQAASVPGVGDCVLGLVPSAAIPLQLVGAGPGRGSAMLPAVVPAGLTGVDVHLQAFCGDPGVSGGYATTPAFRVTF